MAFVTAPDFAIKSIQWNLNRPAQVNVGAYNGVRTVSANPWFSQWSAHVDLAYQQGESGFRSLRSFFVRCRGSINTFRLYATPETQNLNYGVTANVTAAQGATSMQLAGVTTAMLEGQFITVNGQLLVLTSVLALDGSTHTQSLNFEPALRQSAAAGTPVVTSRPYALVYLSNPEQTWTEANWRLFTMGFDVAEAINGTDGATIPETELVANGTFGTDTSSWVASANAALSNVAGRMRVTSLASSPNAWAFQSIAVISGKSYRFSGDVITGTATTPTINIGSVSGGSQFGQLNAGVGGSLTFTPTSSPVFISCVAAAITAAGQTADFDNISLREA